MTYLLALLGLALLMAWRRHLHLGRYRTVRSRRVGWLTAELRYRDFLEAPNQEAFPEPREERLVVWRLLGCVVYVRRRSVALPSQCDARINHISERDFDARFENDFRLTAW
ncbi:hypothetical protein [Curvibacter gracilis]|uniref:hypothetical protein n=1 Tax=Curvibacter gracilis TaxID=230310 RepID=UPI00048158D0|nr:hypothetical protein [Curvibacter gracilis]